MAYPHLTVLKATVPSTDSLVHDSAAPTVRLRRPRPQRLLPTPNGTPVLRINPP